MKLIAINEFTLTRPNIFMQVIHSQSVDLYPLRTLLLHFWGLRRPTQSSSHALRHWRRDYNLPKLTALVPPSVPRGSLLIRNPQIM